MSKVAQAIAETTAGKIEGNEKDGLYVFKGIPYAAPPVGERRWLPPQPVEPWAGVRQTQSFENIAPQNPSGLEILDAMAVAEPQNEDCLYLNIWSPGLDDARRPVLFWIHGGGFTIGSGSPPVYNGRTLSKRGNAVVVTINYRLGSLGFLNLNEVTGGKIATTGNEGLLDQIAALQWVRDNITAFGGDPDNVTIFGESAGGMSVGCLMAMPQARGLFHKAVPQSGAANTAHPLDTAVKVAETFLSVRGLSGGDVDALRALTVEQLLAGQRDLVVKMMETSGGTIGMPLQPVIDGELLPALPIDSIKAGSADGIPVLAGSTLEEWKLFTAADPNLAKLDDAGLVTRLQRLLPDADAPGLVEAYRNARAERGQTTTPADLFVAIQTDRVFRLPAIRLAEVQQGRGNPAYNYLFTWQSPLFGGVLGACHALELGFLWGTYEPQFSGTGPDADALARNIQDAWLAFAHTGDPSCQSLGAWPPYNEHRHTMLLGKECSLEEALYDEERRAWDSIPEATTGSI